MKWRYLLFDLDGTLTDSGEGILNCVKYAYDALGLSIPSEDMLLRYIGPPLIEGFQQIAGLDCHQARQAVDKYRERYSVTGLFENHVYEGMGEALKALREMGYEMAVATSKPEVYAVQILEHFGLEQYFCSIVGSTLDGKRDSKADVIGEALARLGLADGERERVLMIGDRRHDILGAKAWGIESLGVYYGYASPGELEEAGADYLVSEVAELIPFFRSRE